VLTIGANRAIDLIVQKESGGGGSRFGRASDPGACLAIIPTAVQFQLSQGASGLM